MPFTISVGDTRAAFITGAGMTFGDFWGVDSSVANGAQPVAQFFDREGTAALRIIRGTSGTTNLAVAVTDANVTGFAKADAVGTTWAVAATVAV